MKVSFDRESRIVTVENDGQRTYKTMRQGLDRALHEFRDGGRIKLLVDWTSFQGSAPDAFDEQFKVSSQLALMCTAIAFVCDDTWAPATEKAKLIFSDIPCERFGLNEKTIAVEWLGSQ